MRTFETQLFSREPTDRGDGLAQTEELIRHVAPRTYPIGAGPAIERGRHEKGRGQESIVDVQ